MNSQASNSGPGEEGSTGQDAGRSSALGGTGSRRKMLRAVWDLREQISAVGLSRDFPREITRQCSDLAFLEVALTCCGASSQPIALQEALFPTCLQRLLG